MKKIFWFFIIAIMSPYLAKADTQPQIWTVQQVEEIIDKLEAEPPDYPDIDCHLNKIFDFTKLSWDNEVPGTPDPALCDFAHSFTVHLTEKLSQFWPLQSSFGLVIGPIHSSESFNASFNTRPILNKPTAPYFNLLYLKGAPLAPQSSVWSHEYGHAVLQEILENYFYPKVRAQFIKRVTTPPSKASVHDKDEITKLEEQDDKIREIWGNSSAEEIKELQKQQASVRFQIKVNNNKTENGENPVETVAFASYHEFFADIFAAFFSNNPNSIGDAFVQLKIFAHPDWRQLRPTSPVLPQGWTEYEPHILLTPARHYFGHYLLPKVRDQKQFLKQLSVYIASVLETPNEKLFLSYEPFIAAAEKSATPEELSAVFRSAIFQIRSKFDADEVQLMCEFDFAKCKTGILEQLRMGRKGIFETNLNPEIANIELIEAMQKFAY